MQRDLVERAQGGDHDAFASLAGAAIFRLDAAARLILRDPDEAKDAVQETLVRAWRDLPTLRSPDRFDAWLHRLLVRSCVDEARRLRRHRLDVQLTQVDSPHVPDGASSTEQRDEIERGFRRLDTQQRAVVVLHHYLDLPLPEVANALGIPLGTAKSRLSRGWRRCGLPSTPTHGSDPKPWRVAGRRARRGGTRSADAVRSATGGRRGHPLLCRRVELRPVRALGQGHRRVGRSCRGGSCVRPIA